MGIARKLHELYGSRNVMIFGAGEIGKRVFDVLKQCGIETVCFVDNNPRLSGSVISGLPVISPKNIKEYENKGAIIQVASKFSNDIMVQLRTEHTSIQAVSTEDFLKAYTDNAPGLDDCFSDGIMRLRITNFCGGKCRFCGQKAWDEKTNHTHMPREWLFDYIRPVYKRIKQLLVTGGDAFSSPYSEDFLHMISKEYPHVNVMTESNGVPFTEKWWELFSDNLMLPHFSVNGSNEDVFIKGCWNGDHGKEVYRTIINNLGGYVELLKEKKLLAFAPNYSMVINRDNYEDVYDFVCLCLRLHARSIGFYFDYAESRMSDDYFGESDSSRKALKTLLELETLLKDRVSISFRLWLPLKELEKAQKDGYEKDAKSLKTKYREADMLAQGRSVKGEWEERNRIRSERRKRTLSFEEDIHPSLHKMFNGDKWVCSNPWRMIDLYPTGRIEFCGWYEPKTLDFNNFIHDGKVNWEEIYNHPWFRFGRNEVMNGCYWGCMKCCPMIDKVQNGE
mgnify:CR=1 FL=1